MEVTTKDLRTEAGRIVKLVTTGKEVVVTYRGNAVAKIIPVSNRANVDWNRGSQNADMCDDDLSMAFGMWADDERSGDVDTFVRSMRQGRFSAGQGTGREPEPKQ